MLLLSIFVPNKIIEIDDRDPPWMNGFIKNKIKQKKINKAFKLYNNNRMGDNFSNLQKLLQDFSEVITKRKEDYNPHNANKLNNPQSSQKTFWKILKTF